MKVQNEAHLLLLISRIETEAHLPKLNYFLDAEAQ
jgi:hypothetical protein